MSRPVIMWICSNRAHGQYGIAIVQRPPDGKCSCGRRMKPQAAGLKCEDCGQIQKLGIVGGDCVWCGGTLRLPTVPAPGRAA